MAGEPRGASRDPNILRQEAGVDWITWVAPPGADGYDLEVVGTALLDAQRRATGRSQDFSAHGYKGEQCPGVAMGSRTDGRYLRMSGPLAASNWASLVPCAGRPTRLDSQVTTWLTFSQTSFGARSMRVSRRKRSRRQGPIPKRTLWQDTRGSYCGLVGARTSPRYGRSYDKGVEQDADVPGGCWRIEVEHKAERAEEAWKRLTEEPEQQKWAYKACESSWRLWGLSWPLPTCGESYVFAPRVAKRDASVTASLEWISSQVNPTIQRLLTVVSVDELLTTLGLDAYAEPIRRASE